MLRKVGTLDKATMGDFDTRHLAVPSAIEPAQITQLRAAHKVGKAVFARYLHMCESTFERGETGAK